jgi:hypothetical protein
MEQAGTCVPARRATETKEQIGGVAFHKFSDIDRAVEAWSKHSALRAGDKLEIHPADEEFNARVAAREALVARS